MNVTVESATESPITLISKAAGMCYGKDDAKLSRVRSCIKKGHTSVIEHVSATFKIEGISRACLAQLTRHRIASFSVMSQRYCKIGGEDWYVMPPLNKEADLEAFGDVLEIAMSTYKEAVARGIKPEDARFLLPEATKTNLYMTINARSLQNFLTLRLGKTAQWEIRELAEAIEKALIDLGGEWADLMNILSEVRNG